MDWQPVIISLAGAIPVLATAVAVYLQGRVTQRTAVDTNTKVGEVKTLVNGNQNDLKDRVAALERVLSSGTVTVLHTDERRQSDAPTLTAETGAH